MTVEELFGMFSVYARFIIELSDSRTYPLGEQVYDGTTIDKKKLREFKEYTVESIIPFESVKGQWDGYLHIVIHE